MKGARTHNKNKSKYNNNYASNTFWRVVKKELESGNTINELSHKYNIPSSTIHRKVTKLIETPNFDFSKEQRGKGKKKFTVDQEATICEVMKSIIEGASGCAKAVQLITGVNNYITTHKDIFPSGDLIDRNMLYRFVKTHSFICTGKGISFFSGNPDGINIIIYIYVEVLGKKTNYRNNLRDV